MSCIFTCTKHRLLTPGRSASRCVRCQVGVGIDLGTTNSAIATFSRGQAEVVPLTDGCLVMPSVVAYNQDGQALVGAAAKRQAALNPLNTFSSIKRLVGRQFKHVQALDTSFLLTHVQQDSCGNAALWSPGCKKQLLPEEVLAEVVKVLLAAAERHTGERIREAVITIPADFGAAQRQATVRAGQLAGLQAVSILQEPVAAALAYGHGRDPYAADCILVLDLGGGTYDVSLLDSFEGILEVVASAGDPQLGGDDYDAALVHWLLDEHMGPGGRETLRQDPAAAALVASAVEAAKVQLSTSPSTSIVLPFLGDGGVVAELTRERLEELTSPLQQRLWPPLQRLADRAKVQFKWSPDGLAALSIGAPVAKYSAPPRRVTQVVLVGGATRMPAIQQYVRRLTGIQPRTDVDPETCVALGAAVHCAMMMGLTSGLELMDGSYVSAMHGRASGFNS